MRCVISTHGQVILTGNSVVEFPLPKQGARFVLDRVFASFANNLNEAIPWYFVLVHRNGEGEEVARVSTTVSEQPNAVAPGANEGRVHFFGEAEFRSHLDGLAISTGTGFSQLMTAPLGCEGWEIETNDTVSLYFVDSGIAGLDFEFTMNQIYWHCVFESEKKG